MNKTATEIINSIPGLDDATRDFFLKAIEIVGRDDVDPLTLIEAIAVCALEAMENPATK